MALRLGRRLSNSEFQIKAVPVCFNLREYIRKMDHLSIDVHEKTKLFMRSPPKRQLVTAARQQTQTPGWALTQLIGFKMPVVGFIIPANKDRFVFPSGGASYLPPCSRSYQMKAVEGRSPWLPQPSSRTALGLKLHFHKHIKSCFSASIKFNYYHLLSILHNVSFRTSSSRTFPFIPPGQYRRVSAASE